MLQHARHFTYSDTHTQAYYVRMWVIFQLILIINLIRKSMNERERTKEGTINGTN